MRGNKQSEKKGVERSTNETVKLNMELSERNKLLSAVVEKPTPYIIDVEDNSMLPEKLKKKKELGFTVKPPTINVLAECAIHFDEIPKELLNPEKSLTLNDVLPYRDNMIKAICVIIHRGSDYPDWYEEFFRKNVTPRELFQIFHETSLKIGTDFFLYSFQIANQTNPMMLHKPKKSLKGSTPFV